MLRTSSPLRYPGGKSCLYDLVASILRQNKLTRCPYVEPYAGGCGLALSLLYGGHVSDIYLNDLDPSIWSFWSSVLTEPQALVDLIASTPVTIDEWHRQKAIHQGGNAKRPIELGFATFFLNRTNRSGVIKGAGVIGGLAQTGNYKLDCRFNRDELIRRIRRISKYKNRIHFSNLDAIPFMKKMTSNLPPESFFCIDPPYFNKGASLYTNFYGPEQHRDVASVILQIKQPWIVTYDHDDHIQRLYAKRRQFTFDINYSAQVKRVGSELLIASSRLRLPPEITERRTFLAKPVAA
jgi:DNA adenine methylase